MVFDWLCCLLCLSACMLNSCVVIFYVLCCTSFGYCTANVYSSVLVLHFHKIGGPKKKTVKNRCSRSQDILIFSLWYDSNFKNLNSCNSKASFTQTFPGCQVSSSLNYTQQFVMQFFCPECVVSIPDGIIRVTFSDTRSLSFLSHRGHYTAGFTG